MGRKSRFYFLLRCAGVVVYCFSAGIAHAQDFEVDVSIAGAVVNVHGFAQTTQPTIPDFQTNLWAVFADGYTTGDPKGVHLPVAGAAAQHNGQLDTYPQGFSGPVHGYYSYMATITDPPYMTFGPSTSLHLETNNGFAPDGSNYIGYTTDIGKQADPPPNYTHGACLVEASTTADAGKTLAPATGATVQMWINATYPSPTKVGGVATPGAMVARSKTAVHFVFGTSDATGNNQPDAPFPSGLQADSVVIACTYKGSTKTVTTSGSAIVQHTQNFAFQFGLGTSNTAATYADGAAMPDGLNPATGSGSGSGGTTTTGGSIFDLDSFFSRLKDFCLSLVTPDPAMLDQVKSDWQSIINWGPLSLPAQVKTLWQSASAMNDDDSNPHYWDFPLRYDAGIPGVGNVVPAGYTGQDTTTENKLPDGYVMPFDFSVCIPDHINFAWCRAQIVAARSIEFCVLWLIFAFAIVKKYTPSPQI